MGTSTSSLYTMFGGGFIGFMFGWRGRAKGVKEGYAFVLNFEHVHFSNEQPKSFSSTKIAFLLPPLEGIRNYNARSGAFCYYYNLFLYVPPPFLLRSIYDFGIRL